MRHVNQSQTTLLSKSQTHHVMSNTPGHEWALRESEDPQFAPDMTFLNSWYKPVDSAFIYRFHYLCNAVVMESGDDDTSPLLLAVKTAGQFVGLNAEECASSCLLLKLLGNLLAYIHEECASYCNKIS
mmetsp:Transcript_73449/g.145631  ORF Transcript_73449/g.145631 Transcript_73449/m.145631 type:complete len:128 (+) Transcript_73449:88-471(+)